MQYVCTKQADGDGIGSTCWQPHLDDRRRGGCGWRVVVHHPSGVAVEAHGHRRNALRGATLSGHPWHHGIEAVLGHSVC